MVAEDRQRREHDSPSATAPTAIGRLLSSGRMALATHLVSLFLGFVSLLYLARREWFHWDEFEFLARRQLNAVDLLRPLGEHIFAVPIFIYRVLYRLFGLHSYRPYVTVLIVIHLLIVHLLWRGMIRWKVAPWIAVGLSASLIWFGAGYESILWAFTISHNLAILFPLCQLLLVDHDGPTNRRDVLGGVLGVLGIASSGYAYALVTVPAAVAYIRRGAKAALLVAGPSFAALALWYSAVGGRSSVYERLWLKGVAGTPVFIWHTLTETLASSTGLPGTGALLAVMLGVWAIAHYAKSEQMAPAVLALGGGVVLLLAITGLVRVGPFGPSIGADTPRYLYTCWALLLPLVGAALTASAGRSTLRHLAILLVIAVGVWNGAWLLLAKTSPSMSDRNELVAAAEVLRSGEVAVISEINPSRFWILTVEDLQKMIADGAVPAGEDLSDQDLRDAAARLQVAFTEQSSLTETAPFAVERISGAASKPVGENCLALTAPPESSTNLIAIQIDHLGTIPVFSPRGATLTDTVSFPERSWAEAGYSTPRTRELPPGATRYIAVSAAGATLDLHIHPGDALHICNVRLS